MKTALKLRAVAATANADPLRAEAQFKSIGDLAAGIPAEAGSRVHPVSWSRRVRRLWPKAGADPLFAIECCVENKHRADFLDWRTCRVAA